MYKFKPLIKQALWGSENWVISGVNGNETLVANGQDKGKSLNELVKSLKERLVGKDNYERFGDEFPLLI